MELVGSIREVTAFILTYDQPIECPAQMVCIHEKGSSWTKGRNSLVKEIYKFESQNSKTFKYWLFSDEDVISTLACQSSKWDGNGNKVSFCMKEFIEFLLSDHSWAQVYLRAENSSQLAIADCLDAKKIKI